MSRGHLWGVLLLVIAIPARVAEAPRDPVPSRVPGPLFPSALAPMLDAAARDRWQKPEKLIAALRLRAGHTVADVGAGSGYMMAHLAAAVGPSGRVYAEEIQPPMLRLLRARARALPNVVVCRGSDSDPGLPPASLDRALLLTAYHEMTAPVALLSRLRHAMCPGGRLLIVDWNDFATGEETPSVPPGERVPVSAVCREAARAGWRLVDRHDFLPYQYCLEFGVGGG